MRRFYIAAALLCTIAGAGAAEPSIKPSVTYAASWASALQEAKVLNLPIVVHIHGFY